MNNDLKNDLNEILNSYVNIINNLKFKENYKINELNKLKENYYNLVYLKNKINDIKKYYELN